MMEFTTLFEIGLTVSTVGTLAGLGLLRGTVTNLREQLRDAREHESSMRAERAEDKAAITRLQTDLLALGRVVTGEAHWTAIGAQLEVHHASAQEHWRAEHQLLEDVRDLLKEIG